MSLYAKGAAPAAAAPSVDVPLDVEQIIHDIQHHIDDPEAAKSGATELMKLAESTKVQADVTIIKAPRGAWQFTVQRDPQTGEMTGARLDPIGQGEPQ